MELKEILFELIALVKGAAPIVWEMGVRQVYVDAARVGLFAVLTFVVDVVFLYQTGRWRKGLPDSSNSYWDKNDSCALMWVIGLALAIAFVIMLCTIAGYLINPNYYAVKLLITLAKGQ